MLKKFLRLLPLIILASCASHVPVTGVCKSTKTYNIKGKNYTPQKHYNYKAVGMASWYGPGFHGKKDACGLKYDQHQLTAAHKTLPLPCIGRVTNLENGKSTLVLFTDRGPFCDPNKRIIDVSKGAAHKLDMVRNGVARVHVEVLPEHSAAFSNYIAKAQKHYGKKVKINWYRLFEHYFIRQSRKKFM